MSSRLLPVPGAEPTDEEAAPTCQTLIIGSTTYRHSAAQFWPRLIDEMRECFPTSTHIELSAVTAAGPDPARLDPLAELQRDLDSLASCDFESVLRETVAELSLLGPPGLVRVRVLDGAATRLDGELPADAVDTESFLYLASWLLEWARLPHADWAAERLDGRFVGRDTGRRRDYHLRFSARRDAVREGLHRLTLTLEPRVDAR